MGEGGVDPAKENFSSKRREREREVEEKCVHYVWEGTISIIYQP